MYYEWFVLPSGKECISANFFFNVKYLLNSIPAALECGTA